MQEKVEITIYSIRNKRVKEDTFEVENIEEFYNMLQNVYKDNWYVNPDDALAVLLSDAINGVYNKAESLYSVYKTGLEKVESAKEKAKSTAISLISPRAFAIYRTIGRLAILAVILAVIYEIATMEPVKPVKQPNYYIQHLESDEYKKCVKFQMEYENLTEHQAQYECD